MPFNQQKPCSLLLELVGFVSCLNSLLLESFELLLLLDNLLGDEIRKGKTPQTWVDFVKLAMDAEAENE